jgi:hypothetical protein
MAMKIGKKIEATQFIETVSCIDGTWKIAAVQDSFPNWRWFGEFKKSANLREFVQERMFAKPPTISACQGQQFVDGFWKLCLYVRAWPGRG